MVVPFALVAHRQHDDFRHTDDRRAACSDMARASRLSSPAVQAVQGFLNGASFVEPGLQGLEIFGGERIDSYTPPSMELFSSAIEADDDSDADPVPLVWRTFLRCCIPATEAARNAQSLFELAAALFDTGRWHCGHAGYSLYWNTGDIEMARELEQHGGLLLHYPPLCYHDPFAFEPFIGHGLPQVGWITMLGVDLCSRLGSMPTPAEFAGTQVGVVGLGAKRGVMLLAAISPTPGCSDPVSAVALEPYRQIGRRLAAVSLPDERLEFHRPGTNT